MRHSGAIIIISSNIVDILLSGSTRKPFISPSDLIAVGGCSLQGISSLELKPVGVV